MSSVFGLIDQTLIKSEITIYSQQSIMSQPI